MPVKQSFNIKCKQCKRLVKFLKQVKKDHPEYYSLPVPAFGDENAKLLIVGLAPGMHGANATGRPFTGDDSGDLLYKTLYKYGFASAESSLSSDDGLTLDNCRITNVVKCLPPENKPVADEVNNCNKYLQVELSALGDNAIILPLGGVAHKAVIKALDLKQRDYKFSHQSEYVLESKYGNFHLLSSYHCSRYNTSTKRLTPEMFNQVFARAKELLTSARA